MKATSYRPWVALTPLGLLLAAALAIGINARDNGMTVAAHVATTMQLHGSLDTDEGSVAPDSDADEKTATCARRDPHCPSLKKAVALLQSDDGLPHDSKAFAAPGDEMSRKAKD